MSPAPARSHRGWSGRGRLLVTAVALVAAAVAVRSGAASLADGLAVDAALVVADVGDALADDRAALADADEDAGPPLAELVTLGDPATVELPRGLLEQVTLPPSPRSAPRPASARPASPVVAPSGILIRAAAVRAAVARGGMPSGSPVTADGARPAGLVLSGVSGYGTALRDGDVLVRVGGTPATSEGRVIAAVSGAVRSGARAIDGEVWRAGRRIAVVVELPRFRKPTRKPRG